MVFCCFWELPSPFTFSENPLGVLLRHSQINMFWRSHDVHHLAPVRIWGPEAMSWLPGHTKAWCAGVPLALMAPFSPTPALLMSMLVKPFVPVYTQVSQSFYSVDCLGLKSPLLTVPSSKDLGMNLLFWLGEELKLYNKCSKNIVSHYYVPGITLRAYSSLRDVLPFPSLDKWGNCLTAEWQAEDRVTAQEPDGLSISLSRLSSNDCHIINKKNICWRDE